MKSATQNNKTQVFTKIPMNRILPPQLHMRREISKDHLATLTDSMDRYGLISPILVKPSGGKFRIVAGWRRYAAAQHLHWKQIPAITMVLKDQTLEAMKVHENLIRQDVNPVDEAHYLKALTAKHQLSQAQLAKLLQKSPSYITQRLDILRYPTALLNAVEDGQISVSAARELNVIQDPTLRTSYIAAALKAGITPETAAQWRHDANLLRGHDTDQKKKTGRPTQTKNPETVHLPCTLCGQPHPILESTMYRVCANCNVKLSK